MFVGVQSVSQMNMTAMGERGLIPTVDDDFVMIYTMSKYMIKPLVGFAI